MIRSIINTHIKTYNTIRAVRLFWMDMSMDYGIAVILFKISLNSASLFESGSDKG